MKKVYYEDLDEGSVHWGAECIVDKDEMLEYNRKNDPWPFHVDEEAAAQSSFGGLIASGGYTITLMCRSSHTIYNRPEAPWAFLGGFEWHVRFHLPVRPGDRLRIKITILSKKPSSKPGRGVHRAANRRNQDRNSTGWSSAGRDLLRPGKRRLADSGLCPGGASVADSARAPHR